MKGILVLDIDGVLNSTHDLEYIKEQDLNVEKITPQLRRKFTKHRVKFYLHPKKRDVMVNMGDFVNLDQVAKLCAMIDKYDLDVLAVSSWFKGDAESDIRILKFLGISEPERRYRKAYSTGGHIHRAPDVSRWLNDNPDYTHAVILDDDPYLFYKSVGLEHIHVNPVNGMSESDWQQAYNILERK